MRVEGRYEGQLGGPGRNIGVTRQFVLLKYLTVPWHVSAGDIVLGWLVRRRANLKINQQCATSARIRAGFTHRQGRLATKQPGEEAGLTGDTDQAMVC